ncbi:MAG: penicillin-binding protein 1C [Bacteroidota bacterium]
MKRIRQIIQWLFVKQRRITFGLLAALGILYYFCLPRQLFTTPTCMVLEDKDGRLLGARIATDGQWRFPLLDSLPQKFKTALIEFEDRRFYSHPGIDPKGMARAIVQNIRNKRIVSGGSTLSMQTIRLSRPGKSRSLFQKVIEMILATRLEWRYSKEQILSLYASQAPMGGNVVGLNAASWRYYGKRPALLSWAEAATLAVLPNSPSLIHPGRNRNALLAKRNRLLDRLQSNGHLDSLDCRLAKSEPLPDKPLPLPQIAPHLLDRAWLEGFKGKDDKKTLLQSSIDYRLQQQVNRLMSQHHQYLSANGINNMAVLVLDVKSGKVLAYGGNVIGAGAQHQEAVDIIKAPRSTGSILKPLLYSMMIEEGELLPDCLLPDVPVYMNDYRPENYNQTYDGVVSARRSLIRSLNVPMIGMLHEYGLEKFHFGLQKFGFYSIDQPASHYGLTLIVGGAEASLWEITNTYACMSRTLGNFYENDGLYDPRDWRNPSYEARVISSPGPRAELLKEAPRLSAAAIWLTFQDMQNVERPSEQGDWERFNSGKRIAWKTGTSYGFRDAWAVGTTAAYTVGVWVGNADGEGRPGLVGVRAAAPLLFDVFDVLPSSPWFEQPYDEMQRVAVCAKSGHRPLDICPLDSVWGPAKDLKLLPCPYHQLVHLDADEQWQVHSDCEAAHRIKSKSWFVLPPAEEYYFRGKSAAYESPPPVRPDCRDRLVDRPMQFIYPTKSTKLYVPKDLSGQLSRTVFKIAHREPGKKVHWHLDNTYIGTTVEFHHMELNPTAGKHQLTAVDEEGNRIIRKFEMLQR